MGAGDVIEQAVYVRYAVKCYLASIVGLRFQSECHRQCECIQFAVCPAISQVVIPADPDTEAPNVGHQS